MNDDERYEAFVRLLMKHEPRVRSFLRGLLPTWHDVEEVAQEASLIAWRKFDDFEEGTSFGGWLLTIARFEALNYRRRMARSLGLIDTSLATYPMLRLDPEFMVSVIAVYASMGDPRAAILAEQMLEADMNEGQRRLLIMTQVKIKLNADDLPGAGKVFRKLKKLAPQSEETIQARELIKAAVIKKRD